MDRDESRESKHVLHSAVLRLRNRALSPFLRLQFSLDLRCNCGDVDFVARSSSHEVDVRRQRPC